MLRSTLNKIISFALGKNLITPLYTNTSWKDLISDPMRHAYGHGDEDKRYEFPAKQPEFLPKIYIKYCEGSAAYIHGIHLNHKTKTATIKHFAVETNLIQRGLGKTLAISFFKCLRKKYDIEKIIFDENSSKIHQDYPPFFEKIGANPTEWKENLPIKWTWLHSEMLALDTAGK